MQSNVSGYPDSDDSEEFRSPSADPNQTDYNLSYSSSYLYVQTTKPIAHPSEPINTNYRQQTNRTSTTPEPEYKINKRKMTRPKHTVPVLNHMRGRRNKSSNLIPRVPFGLLVRDILGKYNEVQVSRGFLDALHEASEIYLVQLFHNAQRCCTQRNSETLSIIDIYTVHDMREHHNPLT